MQTVTNRFKIGSISLPLLFLAATAGLTGCDAKPTVFHVEATQGFCDTGFDAWDKPTCTGDMKPASVIRFTIDSATKTVKAEQIEPNPFAKRAFLSEYDNCQINDGLTWRCEVKDKYVIVVKQGHYHHYTLNEDLTLSHFIGNVVQKPAISN